MYQILIKTQPGYQDVDISAEDITEFNMYADMFLNITSDTTSPYYIDSKEVWRRMSECMEHILLTMPGSCPFIYSTLFFASTKPA